MTVIFYIACAVAVFSTIMVITRLNAMHALVYLIVSLLAVAVIFFTLGAAFAAALEVVIYAGAIMVLFVFALMMLNLGKTSIEQESKWLNTKMWIGPAILAFILMAELAYILSTNLGAEGTTENVTPKEIGISLFGPYLLGVELAAILLMGGIVGAFHLGRRKKIVSHRFLKEEIR